MSTYAMSNYLESALFNHIFRGTSYTAPSTLYVGLTSSVPVDSHTGATIPEIPNSNGYARQSLGAPAAGTFGAPVAEAYSGNNAAVTFGPCTSSAWGWCSGAFLTDSATIGAGNVLIWGALSTPKNVGVGDSFQFGVSGIQIQFD